MMASSPKTEINCTLLVGFVYVFASDAFDAKSDITTVSMRERLTWSGNSTVPETDVIMTVKSDKVEIQDASKRPLNIYLYDMASSPVIRDLAIEQVRQVVLASLS